MFLVTGLFFLVLLLNQRWSPLLTLQASHYSIFRIMCDFPSIAVFCSESIECFPGTVSKFFLKLFVTIPVAPIITGTIVHFRFHIRCISTHYYYYYYYYYYLIDTGLKEIRWVVVNCIIINNCNDKWGRRVVNIATSPVVLWSTRNSFADWGRMCPLHFVIQQWSQRKPDHCHCEVCLYTSFFSIHRQSG